MSGQRPRPPTESYGREQPLAKDARKLGSLDRHDSGCIARNDALRVPGGSRRNRFGLGFGKRRPSDVRKKIDDASRLPGKRVGLAGKRHDDHEPVMGARVAMERQQECGELLGAVGSGRLQPSRVLRKLVEHDERLAAFEHGLEIGRARSRRGGCIVADRPV